MPLPPLRSFALLGALVASLVPPGAPAQPATDAAPVAAPSPGMAASSSVFRPTLVPSGEKSFWIPAAEVVSLLPASYLEIFQQQPYSQWEWANELRK